VARILATCAKAPEVLAVGLNHYRPGIVSVEIDYFIGFALQFEARLPHAFKGGLSVHPDEQPRGLVY